MWEHNGGNIWFMKGTVRWRGDMKEREGKFAKGDCEWAGETLPVLWGEKWSTGGGDGTSPTDPPKW